MEATSDEIVLTIGLDANGVPQIEPLDCASTEGPASCTFTNTKVRWRPAVDGRQWLVAFPEKTPFQQKLSVFSSDGVSGGRIVGKPQKRLCKYWVIYEDDDGRLRAADPKIVIQDGPPGISLQTLAEQLTYLEQDAQSLAALATELRESAEEIAGSSPAEAP